jgi:preprotein translocase subunit SecF
MADDAAQAVTLEQTIRALPSVGDVQSMSQYLVGDQSHKLQIIEQIKQVVAGLEFPQVDLAPVNLEELSRTLWSLQGYLGLAAETASGADTNVQKQLVSLRETIAVVRKQMLTVKPGTAAERLAGFQRSLLADVQETFQAIQSQDNQQGLRPEDLPPALRQRFIGRTGKYLLQVFPRKNVWQRENQQEFVGELRHALDSRQTGKPIITGDPVQLFEYTSLLKDSYQMAAWYSLATIAVLVWVHFRNLTSVVLALVPVLIGAVWLGGIMGCCGISFNPANIMTLPLVIGIGVTNGIHILNRFAEEKNSRILAKSTGKAVLISGMTTIAGFGSLILAEHQGIKSLGYVMAAGVATCMVAGLMFLPALLHLHARKR